MFAKVGVRPGLRASAFWDPWAFPLLLEDRSQTLPDKTVQILEHAAFRHVFEVLVTRPSVAHPPVSPLGLTAKHRPAQNNRTKSCGSCHYRQLCLECPLSVRYLENGDSYVVKTVTRGIGLITVNASELPPAG